VLLVVGFLNPGDAGYGGATEQIIGVGILALSLLLFVYRRLVQDRTGLRLREDAPAAVSTPAEAPGSAARPGPAGATLLP